MGSKKQKKSPEEIKMPKLVLDLEDPFIRKLSKKILFLDIETSLIEARIFRPGQQQINANQLTSKTRILTMAGGYLYDMLTKKEEGMWSCSNHRSTTFNKDPLDDTEILATIWHELDKAEVVVAHNAVFDRGWLLGRFLEKGWKMPSKFFLFCTYQNLRPFNMVSKKLDELSKTLIGNRKVAVDYELWYRCSEGDKYAFEKMEEYNLGDIYETLFKVWLRTAYYNPHRAIDFTNPQACYANCRVDGSALAEYGTYRNRSNGLTYNLYINERAGIQYIDRYNDRSIKAGTGLVRPHLGY